MSEEQKTGAEGKRTLRKLVEKHGFFEVARVGDLSYSTLGIYMDDSNDRYIAQRTLRLLVALLE